MRAFIAIPSPEDVKREIREIQETLSATGRFTMVSPENMHLTTNFLGEIKPDQARSVIKQLESLKSKKFCIALQGLSTFPGRGTPRVVWIGVSEGARELVDLQALIKTLIEPCVESKDEKEFRPHLTIARVKGIHKPKEFETVLERFRERFFCRYAVDHIDLMESKLTPSGPVYSLVERFRFG